MKQFETGKTYSLRFIGDSDLVVTYNVTKRTASTITIREVGKTETKTLRIAKKLSEFDGRECVRPFGEYSMCPILRA